MPLVKETIFSPLYILTSCVSTVYSYLFVGLILALYSVLFLCQCHAVLITVALQYCLKSQICQFSSFLKKKFLGFFDPFIVFYVYFIYSLSDIYYCLPPANFGFACSFSNSFRQEIGFLTEYFSCFFEEGLYHYELPSQNYCCCIPQILLCYILIVICLEVFSNFFFIFIIDSLVFWKHVVQSVCVHSFPAFLSC